MHIRFSATVNQHQCLETSATLECDFYMDKMEYQAYKILKRHRF